MRVTTSGLGIWLGSGIALVGCGAEGDISQGENWSAREDDLAPTAAQEGELSAVEEHIHEGREVLELDGTPLTLPPELDNRPLDFVVRVNALGQIERKVFEVTPEQRLLGTELRYDLHQYALELGRAPLPDERERWYASRGLPDRAERLQILDELMALPGDVILLSELAPGDVLVTPEGDALAYDGLEIVTATEAAAAYGFDYESGFRNQLFAPCSWEEDGKIDLVNAKWFGAASESAKVLCYYNVWADSASNFVIHFTYPNYWTGGDDVFSLSGIVDAVKNMTTTTTHGNATLSGNVWEDELPIVWQDKPRICVDAIHEAENQIPSCW